MIKEAIILAGGLGTRLKGVINDIPKPMAPISDTPFIQYLFEYLILYKVKHVVLAVGYKHQVISDYYGDKYKSLKIDYAIENTPLGTGGAIANAISQIKGNNCFLLNGDSLFNVNLFEFNASHKDYNADLSLSLKQMKDFNRYGTVEFNDNNKIVSFLEKKPLKEGYINGGTYIISKSLFTQYKIGEKFSFEQDIMEKKVLDIYMSAFISNGYFIDIGIPEDYSRAEIELPKLFRVRQ